MTGGTRIIHITRQTRQWHEAFFRHAEAAFGIDFRQWSAAGGWTSRYAVIAIADGERILSTIGMTRMVLSLAEPGFGAEFRRLSEGLQLGCIATAKGHGGRGHGRFLMEHLLEKLEARPLPVMLFSSEAAADYYPRFGFRPVTSHRFRWPLAVTPGGAGGGVVRLDPQDAADRNLLLSILAVHASHAGALSARPDPGVMLWYFFNTPLRAYHIETLKAVAFVEEEDGRLFLRDWLGPRPERLERLLPALIERPVRDIETGFVPPEGWMPPGYRPEIDGEARLFIRGLVPDGAVPLHFPDLLRT